ncbi:MAG: LacI family DNA-binding transcriptional regulator, partial [Candidatus Hydrogenedentes bacterium]|nr:LacI family DNA-binding transcriptional regulator [Candidatus Hydrogenedentota bacterium]
MSSQTINHREFSARPVTIRDVAVRAGVSKKTVSRVINNEPHVMEQTATRVREAIRALGYVPNVSARRLAHGRSFALGIAFCPRHGSLGGWFADFLDGADEVSAEEGYHFLLHLLEPSADAAEKKVLRLIDEGSVDGLLLLPPYGRENGVTEELVGRGVPFVRVDPPSLNEPWPSVFATNRQGAAQMAEYLVSNGHRRIGFITGELGWWLSRERLAGFQEVVARHGLDADPELTRQGDFTFESGVVQGRHLLRMERRPTAIFASNDEMASGVLHVAHQMGLGVPGDVSVAGYDDITWARRMWPPLTTVRQP